MGPTGWQGWPWLCPGGRSRSDGMRSRWEHSGFCREAKGIVIRSKSTQTGDFFSVPKYHWHESWHSMSWCVLINIQIHSAIQLQIHSKSWRFSLYPVKEVFTDALTALVSSVILNYSCWDSEGESQSTETWAHQPWFHMTYLCQIYFKYYSDCLLTYTVHYPSLFDRRKAHRNQHQAHQVHIQKILDTEEMIIQNLNAILFAYSLSTWSWMHKLQVIAKLWQLTCPYKVNLCL